MSPTALTVSLWFRWDGKAGCNTLFYSNVYAPGAAVIDGHFQCFANYNWAGTNFPVTAGEWVHATVTYGPSGVLVYRNGALVCSLPAWSSSLGGFDVGRVYNQMAYRHEGYLDGAIDDMRIYNRVLTPVEIAALAAGAGNQAPTVTLTSPANGATFTAPATIALAATALDTDGTVSKVEFYQGATKLGEDSTSPYSFTWSGVGVGSYSLTAKATDNSNTVTTSSAILVTVSANP
ncbi:hypothetical protein LDC_2182, partial [sediment metagenome]